MRVLLIDHFGGDGALDIAMRAQSAGHQVKWHFKRTDRTKNFGKGIVPIIDDWREYARWADIIILADNTKYLREVDAWRKQRGCLVLGATCESAAWELDRTLGQSIFKKNGIPVLPYKEFSDYDEAIRYVMKENRRFVSKPCGDEPDKSLSYVSKSPADLVYMLTRWKKAQKLKGRFLLQEFVKGTEMAVGAWFGPDGFAPAWCENFEEKSLFPGGLGPACFTPDAECLTREGWKFWPDVTMDDEICTLKEGKIEYERPSQVIAERFVGNLVGWKSPTVDILVTPGHQMYVQDDHYRKPFFFEPASKSYHKRRTIMRAGGTWAGEDGSEASCAWAALLGAYIADGSCQHSGRAIVFGNCPTHKQGPFIEIAARAGYTAKMYGKDLYINSVRLVSILKPLGRAHEKSVPQYIKDSSPNVIRAFLHGYGTGDGTRAPANLIYTTVSKRLADDLQELCLKIGVATSINSRDRRDESHEINGVMCFNRRIAYDISVCKKNSKAEVSADNRYLHPYEGTVYCVTVSSHVIFTRRNGKACWIGQTGEMGTTCVYFPTSKLATKVLKPLEDALSRTGHTGYVDVNCIIDESGDPWPLEFTMRPGWPTFNIQQALHEGDPIEWLATLSSGQGVRSKPPVSMKKPCVGVVMALPDFPYSHITRKEVTGIPIYLKDRHLDQIHLCEAMTGEAPQNINGKVVTAPSFLTSGDYVLVVTGTGETIRAARESAYRIVEQIEIPASPFWRKDIGQRLAKCLSAIQSHGYATNLQY